MSRASSAIDEDEAGAVWPDGVVREWSDDLRDPQQDLYTIDDGQPHEGEPVTSV